MPASKRSPAHLLAALLWLAACDPAPVSETPAAEGPQVLGGITRPVDGGDVHLVRMVQRGDRYAFEPAEIPIRNGDVVRFVMVGSQPESVAFELTEVGPEMAEYVRANSLERGVLLTEPGQSYDVAFRDAPPGRYPFLSAPHAVQGMRGAVIVISPDTIS